MDLIGPRQAVGGQRENRVQSPPADGDTKNAAAEGEHHALGQQLADQSSAFGAKCGADRELATTARGTREEQVGNVGAGDEQDESDGAEHDLEGGPNASG